MAPSFVNKDYVTAGSLIALHMHIMRYLLGHKLLCALGIYELHIKAAAFTAASWLCPLGQPLEERR